MILVFRVLIATLLFALASADPGYSQDRAALIADEIEFLAGNELRAAGNVEVLYQGFRLRATAITYSADRETITIEGPMSLTDGEGNLIVLAEGGQLDQELRNGILHSARFVLNKHLQIAGEELRRVDGRYTQLDRAVASTCSVCAGSDVPFWQIRASRVVHDQVEQRIYYYNALMELAGIPIFYTPRLRMPDATVRRASGFLVPELKQSTTVGSGLIIPYFQTIGDHADILFSPYFSSKSTTLGLRFRQIYKTGAVSFSGAGSTDDLTDQGFRGYLFGKGAFFLPNDFRLDFDVKLSSDEGYLFDYGISGQDRLRSDVTLSRTRRNSYFKTQTSAYRSFRDDEESSSIPAQIGEVDFRSRLDRDVFGGAFGYRLQAYGLGRPSTEDVVGRDYARVTGGLDWSRDAVFGPGIKLSAIGKLDLDHYVIDQDSTTKGGTRVTSTGAIGLGYPMVRLNPNGSQDLLEPRIQFIATDAKSNGIPNEESTLVEFDEAALFALDRIPGATDYEIGHRINAGVTWSHDDPNGWQSDLTVGRVFRFESTGQFSEASGLSGMTSHWLISGQAKIGPNLNIANRMLIADNLDVTRTDIKVAYDPGNYSIAANLLWQKAEPEIGRDLDIRELDISTRIDLGRHWEGGAEVRYDFETDKAASLGLSLVYKSRCATVELGYSRSVSAQEDEAAKSDFTIALSVPPAAVASRRPTLQCSP